MEKDEYLNADLMQSNMMLSPRTPIRPKTPAYSTQWDNKGLDVPSNEKDNEFQRTNKKPDEKKAKKVPTQFLLIGAMNLLLFIIVVFVISDLLASNEANKDELLRFQHDTGAA